MASNYIFKEKGHCVNFFDLIEEKRERILQHNLIRLESH
jgi:hypothetical protein